MQQKSTSALFSVLHCHSHGIAFEVTPSRRRISLRSQGLQTVAVLGAKQNTTKETSSLQQTPQRSNTEYRASQKLHVRQVLFAT